MPHANLAYSPPAFDRRRAERDAVFFRTRLIVRGVEHGCELVNLSTGGFMIRCEHPVPDGERVILALPRHGGLGARVIWTLGGRIGCELIVPISDADYPRLLAGLPRD